MSMPVLRPRLMYIVHLVRKYWHAFWKQKWSRKKIIIVAAITIAFLLAVLGGFIWLHTSRRPATQTSQVPDKPAQAATAITPQQAKDMGDKLSSGQEADFRTVVAVADSQQLNQDAIRAIAVTGPVTLDAATFHDNGDGTASIVAHLAKPDSGSSSNWTLQLLNVDGSWKVSFTDSMQ